MTGILARGPIRGQGLARGPIKGQASSVKVESYQKSEFPSALAECEDDGLQSTRMPENI